jgi:predicted DNA-binding transcriptional regulator YafY
MGIPNFIKPITVPMGYLEHKEKLDSLLYFVKSKSAVNVDSLSKKLEISERTVMRMIETLRLQGIDIKYCKKSKAYIISE